MQLRHSEQRRVRKYINFHAAKPIISPTNEDSYIIPILPTDYQDILLPVTTIRMAYVSFTQLKNIMKQCPIPQSSFNKLLSQFPFRIVPIIDPHRLNSDFSVSRPLLLESTSTELISTQESGEFANLSIPNHMIQSFWFKSTMHSFDLIDSSKLLAIMNYSFGRFKFQRSRTPCLGINIYNGK